MFHLLDIDLTKAGKKGAQWAPSKRTYLFRIVRPDGKYEYFPDTARGEKLSDYGTIDDSGEFHLNPGVSLAGIFNQRMFGGFTGKVNKKTGRPEVKDGMFRHYEVVSKTEYKNAMALKGKYAPGTPEMQERRKFLSNLGEHSLSRTTEGGYYIFEYPRVPVVARHPQTKKEKEANELGKPAKFGGFIGIDWHPSLKSKYGFKPSQKILDHHITDPEHIAIALDASKGHAIAPGKKAAPERELPFHVVATPLPGETGILNPPVTTEETRKVLGLEGEPTEDSDPLTMAQLLRDRILKGKKAKKPEDKKTAIAGFPSWVLGKFENEQELLDKLQNEPATTLVTLGVYKPTPWTRKLNDKLTAEWAPKIYRMCRHDVDAFKATKLYEHWKALDEAEGIDPLSPESHVNRYRLKVTSELAQEALTRFTQLSYTYQADQKPTSRFDRYAYTVVNNYTKALSKKWAEDRKQHGGTTLDIVANMNVEEAANEMRQGMPLSAHEMSELRTVTPVARAALARIFNDTSFPEAYRRILAARLFLDDLDLERQQIKERADALDIEMAEADVQGKERPTRRAPSTWRRNLTGKDSIAEAYDEWTDPDTGLPVRMSNLSVDTQARKLTKWFNDARRRVISEISVPVTREDPITPGGARDLQARYHMPKEEWNNPWGRVEIEATPEEYTDEEKLTYAALGQPKMVTRILTNEGRHLKRYFELEAKIADSSRRALRPSTAQEEDLSTKPVPGAAPKPLLTGPVKHVLIVPSKPIPSPKAEMAAAHAKPMVSPVASLPTGPAHPAVPAVTFFTASKNQKLAQRLGLHLDRIGAASQPKAVESGKYMTGHVPVYVQPHTHTLGMQADRELDLAQQHYDTLIKLQKESHEALEKRHQKLQRHAKRLDAIPSELEKLHEAAARHQHVRRRLQEMADKRAERRAELDPMVLTPAEIKAKLKIYTPTKKDKKELESTYRRYLEARDRVGAVLPDVAQRYEHAFKVNEHIDHPSNPVPVSELVEGEVPVDLPKLRRGVSQTLLGRAQNTARAQLALVEFEKERRASLKGMSKSLVDVDDFLAAFDAYDFALGRLHAELYA